MICHGKTHKNVCVVFWHLSFLSKKRFIEKRPAQLTTGHTTRSIITIQRTESYILITILYNSCSRIAIFADEIFTVKVHKYEVILYDPKTIKIFGSVRLKNRTKKFRTAFNSSFVIKLPNCIQIDSIQWNIAHSSQMTVLERLFFLF